MEKLIMKRLQANQFLGVKMFEKSMVGNYLLMAKSFKDYVNDRPVSKARQLKYFLINGLIISNAIKFGIIALKPEPWLLVEFGEFLHVFYHKLKIFYFLLFAGGLVIIGEQAAIYYVERQRKFVIVNIFHRMITKNRVEGMSRELAIKWTVNAYLIAKVTIEHQVRGITTLACIIAPIMMYQAYNSDIPHSPFRLAVNGLTFVIIIRQGFLMGMCTIFLFAMSMMFLRFRFMQTMQTIEKCIKDKSKFRRALLEHKQFSVLLAKFSPYINCVIGNLYNLSPMVVIISIQIFLEKDLSLWKRGFLANLFITTASGGYFINKLVTWFPLNNRKIPKMIYPVYCQTTSNQRSVRHLLKLDEFLSSLNKKFLGFYCFNMFKMTKLSFYKFILGISVTYMVIKQEIDSL